MDDRMTLTRKEGAMMRQALQQALKEDKEPSPEEVKQFPSEKVRECKKDRKNVEGISFKPPKDFCVKSSCGKTLSVKSYFNPQTPEESKLARKICDEHIRRKWSKGWKCPCGLCTRRRNKERRT